MVYSYINYISLLGSLLLVAVFIGCKSENRKPVSEDTPNGELIGTCQVEPMEGGSLYYSRNRSETCYGKACTRPGFQVGRYC